MSQIEESVKISLVAYNEIIKTIFLRGYGGNGVFVGVEGGCVGKIIVGDNVAIRLGSGVIDGNIVGVFFSPLQAVKIMLISKKIMKNFFISFVPK